MDDTSTAPITPVAGQPLSRAATGSDGAVGAGVAYLPAPGHTARVGGDWADVVSLDHRRASTPYGRPNAHPQETGNESIPARQRGSTAFVIGDVMGHGPHLAGRSHVARSVLAAALRDRGPAAALHLLDVSWSAVPTWSDTMATACVVAATPFTVSAPTRIGHLLRTATEAPTDEPVTGWVLRWSSAGHPPPLLITRDGTAMTLTGVRHDLPIGVDTSRPRRDHTSVVPDGCTLLLFTDGVIDHRHHPAVVGLDHLTALTAGLSQRVRRDPVATAGLLLGARAPLLDNGDESTLLVAHLDARPHSRIRTPLGARVDAA